MESLINILRRAGGQLEDGWLYLPEAEDWNFDTLGQIIDVAELADNEVDENEEPLMAQKMGLVATLDSGTLESIASYAKGLDYEFTDDLLFESFTYYYEYDAFLPYPGFKPLPSEQHLIKMDRDFYDCLGKERENVECKNVTCQRGAITGSVFCKAHHFEMIQNKSCPFTD